MDRSEASSSCPANRAAWRTSATAACHVLRADSSAKLCLKPPSRKAAAVAAAVALLGAARRAATSLAQAVIAAATLRSPLRWAAADAARRPRLRRSLASARRAAKAVSICVDAESSCERNIASRRASRTTADQPLQIAARPKRLRARARAAAATSESARPGADFSRTSQAPRTSWSCLVALRQRIRASLRPAADSRVEAAQAARRSLSCTARRSSACCARSRCNFRLYRITSASAGALAAASSSG
mmetsp:Transcript_44397/g.96474  ORF Transcript_44397/g.96474 Transcript_44397/m.96474 type:complete len:245 (+) Transcript_44397:1187-1921(+)